MEPKVSMRGQVMPASPIRRLVPYADAARSRGINIYSLNIGQPDIPTPEEGLDALRHIDRNVLEYSPSAGIMSLRKKIVEYYSRYDISLTPEDVIITTGGSEALRFSYLACLDPGDEMIITEPAYANYMGFAEETGIRLSTVKADIKDGFALPPIEEFEKLIRPHSRAILICNPNNPTGYVYSQDELMKLRDLVQRYNLWLISDEVYREFCYTGQPYLSALHLPGIENQVIVLDSASKRYSECGIRVGCLVTRNKELQATVLKYCQARLSPPLLGQIVAEASVDCDPEYMKRNYQEYIERRDLLVNGLNAIEGVYTPMPRGAFYTVVQLPVDDADAFCRWCLTDFQYKGSTVFMAPASGFYAEVGCGTDQVRVAYVLCKEDLKAALEVLSHALDAYPGRIRKKR